MDQQDGWPGEGHDQVASEVEELLQSLLERGTGEHERINTFRANLSRIVESLSNDREQGSNGGRGR